jgi:hypothetical protein
MKKIVICTSLFLFAAFSKNASAQSNSTTGNSEDQPKWKPAGQEHAEYYYLPDIDTYYYVARKQFIYQSGGYWTFSTSLPEANKNYDLYAANKVVINDAGAYRYHDEHKIKYGGSQSNASTQKDQPAIKNKKSNTSGKTSG